MKFANVSKSAILALALVLATSAFAATKGSLQLTNPVTVNGTQLKPGDYKVEWDGAGPNVELSIMQGKKVIAKVPARVVELSTPSSNDAAVVHQNGSGPGELAGVRFGGKKLSLELGGNESGMQANGSSQ